jgi:hypothetical protein
MAFLQQKNFKAFCLSSTFGTPHETEKDRAKREIMEHMPKLLTNDEIIVVDPDAEPIYQAPRPAPSREDKK